MRRFRADKIPLPISAPLWDPTRLPAGMPLDVEVGCGVGFHPIRYARSNPDRFLIAIEHTHTRFEKFERRLAHHEKFENLLAVHADAVEWVTHSLSPESVDRYFFLYPNPWPKSGDEKKRWYAMPFMEKVIETLKAGGTLRLATNERDYAEGAREFLKREWGLTLLEEQQLKGVGAQSPRTHFEKKYLERGETCIDLLFQKSSTSCHQRLEAGKL